VFICREAGADLAARDVCSMNPDGSGLVNLTRTPEAESTPDVSPDGTRIAFTRRASDGKSYLWVMNADGSSQTQLSSVPAVGAAWTPDGRIAFRAQTGASTREYQTVPWQGGNPATLLTGVSGTDFPPRFTAAGAWLYGRFMPVPPANNTFTQQIFVVNGGAPLQITQAAAGLSSNQQPSWSPNGATIVYWRTVGIQQELFTVPAASGTETQLTNSAGVKEEWPQYSPDGSKLIWEQQDATHDFFHKHLVIAEANGANPVAIPTPALDAAMEPVWAPAPQAPAPTPVAAFTATAPAKGKKAKPVPVTLRCIGDTACEVTHTATASVPRKGAKPKVFRIAAKSTTLSARTERVVKVRLPKPAKKLAGKTKKPVTVKIPIAATQPGGAPLIRQLTLTTRLR